LRDIRRAVDAIDFAPIRFKLMDEAEGEGWTEDQAFAAERAYKVFLILNAKYPRRSVVPNKVIDTYWHYHILDTAKYAEDCQCVFGYFLHHFPYFGMRGAEDAANLARAFSETKKLFEAEYGGPMPSPRDFGMEKDAASVCDSSPNCYGTGCTGQRCGRLKVARPMPVARAVASCSPADDDGVPQCAPDHDDHGIRFGPATCSRVAAST
jgi:hypothetical protein